METQFTKEQYKNAYLKSIAYLENIGIKVVVADNELGTEFLGNLDGDSIYVGASLGPEEKFFSIIHLAAHCYQWAVSERFAEIGSQLFYRPSANLKSELLAYELEAARIGVNMLIKLGLEEFTPWFSMYSQCDLSYLDHYYLTGEEGDFKSFWPKEIKNLDPLDPPEISNFIKRVKIQSGIVIY